MLYLQDEHASCYLHQHLLFDRLVPNLVPVLCGQTRVGGGCCVGSVQRKTTFGWKGSCFNHYFRKYFCFIGNLLSHQSILIFVVPVKCEQWTFFGVTRKR